MFCDARMLGWGAGSSSGIAVQVPESYAPGTSPPTTRPGAPPCPSGGETTTSSAEAPGLFERKLTKEEKKRLAEEKRKARKAAKEGKEKE
jgi:hypothetical protein